MFKDTWRTFCESREMFLMMGRGELSYEKGAGIINKDGAFSPYYSNVLHEAMRCEKENHDSYNLAREIYLICHPIKSYKSRKGMEKIISIIAQED